MIKPLTPVILLILMLTSMFGFAQDTLVKRDGQLLFGKVLEVSPTEVKYKKIDFIDGPTYTEIRSTIERIKYQGGHVDIFEEVKKKEPESKKNDEYYRETPKYPQIIAMGSYFKYGDNIVKERQIQDFLLKTKDPEIMYRVKNARASKGLRYVGFAAIPLVICSAVFYSFGLDSYNGGNDPNMVGVATGFLVGSAAVFSASIYFNINRSTQNRKAIQLYNEKYAR